MTSDAVVVHRLLATRHSCRSFIPDPVDPETLQHILFSAQRTASWCNAQPWQVIVTAGEETDALRELMTRTAVSRAEASFDVPPPARYEGSYRDRRRQAGFSLYASLGIEHDDRKGRELQAAQNYRFYGAPHVAVITSEADLGGYGYLDCGGYIANFMLAAAASGVATIAQGLTARRSDVIREHFSLPPTRRVLCSIAFGYADPAHPVNQFRTERAHLDEVVDLRGFEGS